MKEENIAGPALKHTPGPWTSESSRGLIYTETGRFICAMPYSLRKNGLLSEKAGLTDKISPDAHLISAAPQLLEAAKQALSTMRSAGIQKDVRDLLSIAINKAEGCP